MRPINKLEMTLFRLFVLCFFPINNNFSYAFGPSRNHSCPERFRDPISNFNRKDPIRFTLGNNYLPRNSHISDLASEDGNLFLFRTITSTKYTPGFKNKWCKDGAYGYSYTVSPSMPLGWTYYGSLEKDLILIAYQSIEADNLTFPGKDDSHSYPVVSKTLTIDTDLGSIAYYDEIKVRSNRENVIGIIQKKFFRQIIDSHLEGFSVIDIVRAVSTHPSCFVP